MACHECIFLKCRENVLILPVKPFDLNYSLQITTSVSLSIQSNGIGKESVRQTGVAFCEDAAADVAITAN